MNLENKNQLLSYPKSNDFDGRIQLAYEGRENVVNIPKVKNAGKVFSEEGVRYQIMFNGLRMQADMYYGKWMTELIEKLHGHHEPQEEKAFYECLNHINNGTSMIELGGYWGFYSLWFKSKFKDSKVILTEPNPKNLAVGHENAKLNKLEIITELGGVFKDKDAPFGMIKQKCYCNVPSVNVEKLMKKYFIEELDILHADIQGAEHYMLEQSENVLRKAKVNYIFISTHSEALHSKCLHALNTFGYNIATQHTPAESYSFDGLIVASSPRREKITTFITVSPYRKS